MRNPTVIVDAAHNPHGARSLKQTLSEEFDFDAVIGVVAPMGDKDVSGILEELEGIMSRIIVSRNSSHRAASVEELFDTAREIFGAERVQQSESLASAISSAIEQAKIQNAVQDSNVAVVIAGSVVTAGEARAIVRKLKEGR